MADKTGIQWTDATWNPVAGCSIVSPGCTNCYAMEQAAALERRFGSEKYAGLTKIASNGKPVWTGEVRLHEPSLDQPLRWKRGRRIFVNSMSDLFHENLPDEAIDRIFAVMALCPQHTFQVLTKRPARMRDYFLKRQYLDIHPLEDRELAIDRAMNEIAPAHWCKRELHDYSEDGLPLPNVWLGVTAEDQERADQRIPILLDTPAAKRFISAEPLLGPIDLRMLHYDGITNIDALTGAHGIAQPMRGTGARLDWVIGGGESGKDARPIENVEWARALRDQCQSAGVAFFFKQWGEWWPAADGAPAELRHTKHEDPRLIRLGKKASGRLLDGVEHSEFPA